MRVTTAVRAWMTVKPHVPLIKFRKGGLQANDPRLTGAHGGPSGPSHGSPSGASSGPVKTVQKPIIEDYQLPPKYRRAPLSDQEIEYINVCTINVPDLTLVFTNVPMILMVQYQGKS